MRYKTNYGTGFEGGRTVKNQVGMVTYYSPFGKKVRGHRFGFIAQWKLNQRRKRMCDLANVKGWWRI